MDWKKHILTLLNAGMTRDQIAAAMGVTTNAVREILAGRTKSPRADAAIRLLSLRPDIFGPFPQVPLSHAVDAGVGVGM